MLEHDGKALKSGLWYTISSFLVKGVGFLTAPIFTRWLSQEEFGYYSNFLSWQSLIGAIITMNLAASLVSAKYKYKDEFSSYTKSILLLGLIPALVFLLIVAVFNDWLSLAMNIHPIYLLAMSLYMIFSPVIDIYQIRERFSFRYKTVVLLSLFLSISTAILSVAFVLCFYNKLSGRVWGGLLPTVFAGACLLVYFVFNKGKFSVKYWKYALFVSLPYIPHILSCIILDTTDRIMITKICDATSTALYSLAYSCGAIITIFSGSMNTAFSPWLAEALHNKDVDSIRRICPYYITVFLFFLPFVGLLAPEFILLMGGHDYMEAIYAIPPVMAGIACNFLYTMFVNVEQSLGKTSYMPLGTISAAILNVGLNWLALPMFGYIAAAYTTFAGYVWLLLIHIVIVKHIGYGWVYDLKLVFKAFILIFVFLFISLWSYECLVFRYSVLFIYLFVAGFFLWNNNTRILQIAKKLNIIK